MVDSIPPFESLLMSHMLSNTASSPTTTPMLSSDDHRAELEAMRSHLVDTSDIPEDSLTRRKRSWLALEWFGTMLFSAFPDQDWVNRNIARLYYAVYNGLRLPKLSAPHTFNEKMISLKLSDEARAPERTFVTDKEHVKSFVTKRCGPGHVVPTLAVLHARDEVDDFEFPIHLWSSPLIPVRK